MYKANMIDRIERRIRIDSEKSSSNQNEVVFLRDDARECPVARLPITLPIYRMRNGRSLVLQQRYLSENDKKEVDFFYHGEENESAQTIQHDFLFELSRDPKGPIYDELKYTGVQTENLLITSDGIVVNGNRRLAAMRELFLKDSRYYSKFSHVNVAVLPPEMTEYEIEMLEIELQMIPETKLKYGWLERRLKIQRAIEELKIPREKVMEVYRFKSQEELNAEIHQLTLVEEYLEDYLKKPQHYWEVATSEQLFKNLQLALLGKSGENAELRRLLGFMLAKESRNLGERVHEYRAIFGNDCEEVLTQFAQEEKLDLIVDQQETNQPKDDNEEDLIDDCIISEPSPFSPIKPLLIDSKKSHQIATKMVGIYESIQEARKEGNRRSANLRRTKEALKNLNAIDFSHGDPANYTEILGNLKAIIEISQKYINLLELQEKVS
ncbi:hypothetical protein [Peribacillus frigoritolerans]|uniref:hypothetical protein n=1 Tax=Peribacillus frigoritolerans TaxID=450367 RepID=UPI00107112A5|nr:hypothetical protein [Peribacillus frigoritolerans]TFH59639.1 hypothetical protein E4J71_19670 [Peribacillus frigoritolerans]